MKLYTAEQKKQLKVAFARMLDNGETTINLEVAEVDGETGVPKIARSMFHISLIKVGNIENR